jgi:hypothetical protein
MIQRYGENGPSNAMQTLHQKTQPYVTVLGDGSRAQIRLRLLQMNSRPTAGSMIFGVYENQVVKEDGIWRIHGMDLDYVALADYAAAGPRSTRREQPLRAAGRAARPVRPRRPAARRDLRALIPASARSGSTSPTRSAARAGDAADWSTVIAGPVRFGDSTSKRRLVRIPGFASISSAGEEREHAAHCNSWPLAFLLFRMCRHGCRRAAHSRAGLGLDSRLRR